MYIGFNSFHGKNTAACLIFANTSREAKKLAYPIVESWFGGGWLEVKTKMLRDMDYLKSLAISDLPHAIEYPYACQKCKLWGAREIIDGSCHGCNNPLL